MNATMPNVARVGSVQPTRYSHAFFEYIGPTALTVIGRATGKRYRFDRPGARVAVELPDHPSVSGVPQLRQI
ncbi:MAG: hypothetical protein E6G97_20800 [Alphaproteobacteria bacterium]|nr:MAG: hypothetical protein E6G97_20800 [Alphaproteobacteria bacterium]